MGNGQPINIRSFGAIPDSEIEAALQEVWDAPMPPEFMAIDRRTGEEYRVVSEQEQRLREVCSPVGLRRMFPGIRCLSGAMSPNPPHDATHQREPSTFP
jgi:hypothetical protein